MVVSRRFTCPPEQVFEVLRDGWTYPVWVVGASRIRDVDSAWPAPGSRLHHSAGAWPLLLDDSTEVIDYQPPHELTLLARGWPAGQAHVRIRVEDDPKGCLVSIKEDVSAGPALAVPKPIRLMLMSWRNTETLRRLAYLAQGRAESVESASPGESLPTEAK
jgi:hypothetical protein